MRLVLTCGQQLCFYPTFFTRGGSRRAAADSIIPVEPGAPPSWNCVLEQIVHPARVPRKPGRTEPAEDGSPKPFLHLDLRGSVYDNG
jgi:hypothetical protein